MPDEYSERSGLGLDPCAVLALPITLAAYEITKKSGFYDKKIKDRAGIPAMGRK